MACVDGRKRTKPTGLDSVWVTREHAPGWPQRGNQRHAPLCHLAIEPARLRSDRIHAMSWSSARHHLPSSPAPQRIAPLPRSARNEYHGSTAYERERANIAHYGSTESERNDSHPGRTELDVLRENLRFIRDESERDASWEARVAQAYEAKLFKEYAVVSVRASTPEILCLTPCSPDRSQALQVWSNRTSLAHSTGSGRLHRRGLVCFVAMQMAFTTSR